MCSTSFTALAILWKSYMVWACLCKQIRVPAMLPLPAASSFDLCSSVAAISGCSNRFQVSGSNPTLALQLYSSLAKGLIHATLQSLLFYKFQPFVWTTSFYKYLLPFCSCVCHFVGAISLSIISNQPIWSSIVNSYGNNILMEWIIDIFQKRQLGVKDMAIKKQEKNDVFCPWKHV